MICYVRCIKDQPAIKVERIVLSDIILWTLSENATGEYVGEIWKNVEDDSGITSHLYHSDRDWSDYNFEPLMIRLVQAHYSI